MVVTLVLLGYPLTTRCPEDALAIRV